MAGINCSSCRPELTYFAAHFLVTSVCDFFFILIQESARIADRLGTAK